MFRKEELYNNSYKRNPFTNFSSVKFQTQHKLGLKNIIKVNKLKSLAYVVYIPENTKDQGRKTEEDVRNEK